ncbi:cytochrome P450 2C15-like isoform X2 [Paramacrobiotus metropolitanus]|uniref:cytochrome P450 2C15-like isoform X2 n=1 Tax=Paramacrobiotus metropolitanus TaxID=2943436 RepID=UPI002445FCCF|nr:cytochrome P450 2C15-like isoform X2 [Paramacrobiotus metropolitanus]
MLQLLSPVTVVLGLLLIVLAWIFRPKKLAKLPPSPPCTPVIGNLDRVKGEGNDMLEHLTQLTDKYGDNGMCTLYFGPRANVFVSNYEIIKQMLNDDKYAGRPAGLFDTVFKRKGILFTDGEIWKEHRRFALSTLRDFGLGKTWLQDLIIDEARELVGDLEGVNGQPINPTDYLSPSIANVVCAISYGQRFSHKDTRFRRLANLVAENFRLIAKLRLVQIFPIMRFIPFTSWRRNFLELTANQAQEIAFFRELIEDHKKHLDGELRDYIHAFLVEKDKQSSNPLSTYTEEQLEVVMLNLFGAGTETTSTTLTWAIMYLLENPNVYAKVQAEVDEYIPAGQYATLDLRDKLPYTQAVIHEVQRMANLVPFAIRCPTEDVKINGYEIPAGTIITPSLYACHMDPKYFPEPHKFNPERFLDDNGHLRSKVEGFIPFSIGKRFCLGESLARMELFIFFPSLIRHFTFKRVSGKPFDTAKSIYGNVVNTPLYFEIIFEKRQN